MLDPQSENKIKAEQAVLDELLSWLKNQIQQRSRQLQTLSEETLELKHQAWDERLEMKSDANSADNAVIQEELRRRFHAAMELNKELEDFKCLLDRPYFGRLDFSFGEGAEAEAAERFSIGLRSLFDPESCRDYVIDWRAPLASLFYDGEVGPASFMGPEGEIVGCLQKKENIRITKGKVRQVQDCSKEICDENLSEILSRPSSAHMRDIVTSIQQTQNRIIRHRDNDNLLVLGVAGSGKTSVALHRAAWLLYRQPDLSAGQILFLSPNDRFADYISQVLPLLGEENIRIVSITALEAAMASSFDRRYVSFDYEEASAERLAEAASPKLVGAIDAFVRTYARTAFVARDIAFANFTLEDEEIGSRYQALICREGLEKTLEHLGDELWDAHQDLLESHERQLLEDSLRAMLPEDSLDTLYRLFLASPEGKAFPLLSSKSSGMRLDRVDLAVMARIAQQIKGLEHELTLRFVLVDEAQDLLPLEHHLLADGYKATINLFGDFSQAIRFPLPQNYLAELQKLYKITPGRNLYELTEAYRSSYEIMSFASRIMQDHQIKPLKRHGDAVRLLRVENKEEQIEAARRLLLDFSQKGAERIAVICSDAQEKEEAEAALTGKQGTEGTWTDKLSDTAVLSGQQDAGTALPGSQDTKEVLNGKPRATVALTGEQVAQVALTDKQVANATLTDPNITILTAQEAKGLEFDAVLIYDTSRRAYAGETDRRKLYVACTRALHQLALISLGEVTALLEPSVLIEA